MRVAIVGQGPRGIQALCELAEVVPECDGGEPVEVVCFDPQPPGAGAAYDIEQPDFLRLNVRSSILDLPQQPSFVEWLRAAGLPVDDTPRNLVGRYLAECRGRVLGRTPMNVTTHSAAVTRMERVEGRWTLHTAGPMSDGEPFDEVLLTVGHGEWDVDPWEGMNDGTPLHLISSVYPTSTSLGLDEVPTGSRVVVRGAALTFIDVALALGSAREPGTRPAVVIPTSRSGLLLNTKPLPRLSDGEETRLRESVVARLGVGPDAMLAASRELARELLQACGQQLTDELDALLDAPTSLPPKPRVRLARSIAIAEGRAEPEAEWALGRAWALLYPHLVEALSWYDDAGAQAWARFRREAALYERLTFGPTLPQAKRLLTLCDSGFIDVSWLNRRRTLDDLPPSQWREHAEVVVNAVLAPPGVAGNDRPLIADLLRNGALAVAPDGRRGLLITPEAQCIGADGAPTSGLSCLGRVTEDVVIGHDTLNRHAHPHLRWWAERIGDTL